MNNDLQAAIEQQLKTIRADLRKAMNGITSTSMREKGADYKLNFGVELPRLKQLAVRYAPSAELANALWQQATRELKLLALMLFPAEEMTQKIADQWCREIPNQEIREQSCLLLFQRCPQADEMAQRWMSSGDEAVRATGYWLYARLCLIHHPNIEALHQTLELDYVIADLDSPSFVLRTASLQALRFYGRNDEHRSHTVLRTIANYATHTDPHKQEIYRQLAFEFGV